MFIVLLLPAVSEQNAFQIVDIHINPHTLTVVRGGQTLLLQQKPMEVLCFLAAHYPQLVSREQLIDGVWDGNVYVGEKALTNAVWQLRQLFSQLGMPELIGTVRKKGYRLQQAPVSPSALQPVSPGPGGIERQHQMIPPQPMPLPDKVAGRSARLWLTGAMLAVLLLAGVGWWLQPVAQPELMQISRQQGWSLYPTVTPDGHLLVYSHQQYGQNSNLFLQDLREPQSAPRQLTFGPDDKVRPLLSEDGRQVYYSVRLENGQCQIRQLSLPTLQEQLLQTCGRYRDVYLDLSADGRYLYFNGSLTADGRSLYRLDLTDPEHKTEAMPCRQFCQQRVRDVAASPDGQWLALTRRANRLSEEIFLYSLKTAGERQLTFGQSDIRGLEWLPDSSALVYSAANHGRRQGHMLDVRSGQSQTLEIDDLSFASRITRDRQFYFQHDSSVPQLGYLRQHSASAVFPLTAGDIAFQAPDFHNGRQQLVYISTESGQAELWLADAQMQQKKQLTRLGGVLKYPRWSHDGSKVLFVSRSAESTQDRLTILDVQTGQLQFPSTGAKVHGRPTWWHDDSAVILSIDGQLVKVPLDPASTDKPQILTQDGGYFAQMIDASGFYYSKGRTGGVWWQALEGGAAGQRRQLLSGEELNEVYAWTASRDGVFYLQSRRDGVAVRFWSAETAQSRQLVSLPAEQTNLSATPAYDEQQQRLLLEYSPVPRIHILRWQLP